MKTIVRLSCKIAHNLSFKRCSMSNAVKKSTRKLRGPVHVRYIQLRTAKVMKCIYVECSKNRTPCL